MLASNIWPPNVDTIKRFAALSCNGLRFITSGYVNDGFKLGSKHPIQYIHLSTQEGGLQIGSVYKDGGQEIRRIFATLMAEGHLPNGNSTYCT